MALNARTVTREIVSVSTSALNVYGASTWTGADPYLAFDRFYEITNCGSTDLFLDPGGTPSGTSYMYRVGAGDTRTILVRAGETLKAIRASGSGNVAARGDIRE